MQLLRVWWPSALFALMVVAGYSFSADSGSFLEGVVNLVVYGAFSLTGAWIVLRSGNRMGRLFQALSLASASLFLTDSYLATSVPDGAARFAEDPFHLAVLAVNVLLFVPFFLLSFVLPFLFWKFASHVRDQVDLDSLNRELVRVVGLTMQPAHASLWLRPRSEP